MTIKGETLEELMSIEELVAELSNNYTKIIPIDVLKKNNKLYWGGNGVGDRWAKKKYNYTVVYTGGETNLYSENEDDKIDQEILNKFLSENKIKGFRKIIGIFAHSIRINKETRPIKDSIGKEIRSQKCVSCGTTSNIICDHKNDLYNDPRVLNIKTQLITDFQPLCGHCNLQKRQVCKDEYKNEKIYSVKNLVRYNAYPFEFPWEKKVFDEKNIETKVDTYWYDPVEFTYKINKYIQYVYPLLKEIKLIS
jgi:hypothetical protein